MKPGKLDQITQGKLLEDFEHLNVPPEYEDIQSRWNFLNQIQLNARGDVDPDFQDEFNKLIEVVDLRGKTLTEYLGKEIADQMVAMFVVFVHAEIEQNRRMDSTKRSHFSTAVWGFEDAVKNSYPAICSIPEPSGLDELLAAEINQRLGIEDKLALTAKDVHETLLKVEGYKLFDEEVAEFAVKLTEANEIDEIRSALADAMERLGPDTHSDASQNDPEFVVETITMQFVEFETDSNKQAKILANIEAAMGSAMSNERFNYMLRVFSCEGLTHQQKLREISLISELARDLPSTQTDFIAELRRPADPQ